MTGKTLGHYRIEAKLGQGGMGVVYRAADTHLDRTVALKVLPAPALASTEHRLRFVQEAKAASSLNHPNIITIYDIDTARQDGETVHFIAMEFVSGQTLERLAARKGLPLKEALRYAIQIAAGLAAAHQAGIVHRDLKPSNIMVNEQGLVKILDFGLAKTAEREAPDPYAVTETIPVAPAGLTEEGAIVGTVAYMSPEQAEGKRVDARSDVFSFGSVLYQMITGRQAFTGDSKMSTLSAILLKEPQALTAAVGAPPELERIITRCLRKDPRRRWQAMADVKVALEDLLEELESGMQAPAPLRQTRRRWLAPLAAGALAGLVPGGYLAHRFIKPQPPSFHRLTYRRGDIFSAKFAPGDSVVYSAEWDGGPVTLFVAQPGNREARPLDLPSANVLSINPSGEMAIRVGPPAGGAAGTLARVPLGGGAPREILEDVVAADWGPDGETLAVARTVEGKHRVEYPVGTVLAQTELRPPPWIRVSRDGKLVAYYDYEKEAGDYSIAIVGPGQPKRVLSGGWRGIGDLYWSPDGDEIWFSAGRTGQDPALYAVDLRGRERVLAHVAGWVVMHDVGRDGRVLLSSINSRVGIKCLAPGAGEERDLAWLDASHVYEISPDGKQILFVELSYGEGRNPAIYLRRTDGSPAVRLGHGSRPSLSPDGKWVVSIHREAASSSLLLLPTGPGESRRLSAEGISYEEAEWFPDGKTLLFRGNEKNQEVRTFVRDIAGGKPKAITPEGMRAAKVSPDGQKVLIAHSGNLYWRAVEGGELHRLASLAPNEVPLRWSGDGRSVFLQRKEAGGNLKILRLDVASGKAELWREIRTPEPGAHVMGTVALTPDGKYYAWSFQRDLAILYLVTGLK